MQGSLRRRPGLAAAMVAVAAIVISTFGLAAPALAAGTVTVTLVGPVDTSDLTVELIDESGNEIERVATKRTDATGKTQFVGIPNGDAYRAVIFDYRTNPAYTPDDSAFAVTDGDAAVTVTLKAPHVRCSGASTLVGSSVVGGVLTATGTSPTGEAATTTRYSFYRFKDYLGSFNNTVQEGTDPTYTTTAADVGYQIGVAVTYGSVHSVGYDTGRCGDSYYLTPVITLAGTPVTGPPSTPVTSPPSTPVSAPTVSGKTEVGKRLFANPGDVAPGTVVTYQWYSAVKVKKGGQRRVKAIKSATGMTYKVKGKDRGKKVLVAATYTRPGFAPAVALSDGQKVRRVQ